MKNKEDKEFESVALVKIDKHLKSNFIENLFFSSPSSIFYCLNFIGKDAQYCPCPKRSTSLTSEKKTDEERDEESTTKASFTMMPTLTATKAQKKVTQVGKTTGKEATGKPVLNKQRKPLVYKEIIQERLQKEKVEISSEMPKDAKGIPNEEDYEKSVDEDEEEEDDEEEEETIEEQKKGGLKTSLTSTGSPAASEKTIGGPTNADSAKETEGEKGVTKPAQEKSMPSKSISTTASNEELADGSSTEKKTTKAETKTKNTGTEDQKESGSGKTSEPAKEMGNEIEEEKEIGAGKVEEKVNESATGIKGQEKQKKLGGGEAAKGFEIGIEEEKEIGTEKVMETVSESATEAEGQEEIGGGKAMETAKESKTEAKDHKEVGDKKASKTTGELETSSEESDKESDGDQKKVISESSSNEAAGELGTSETEPSAENIGSAVVEKPVLSGDAVVGEAPPSFSDFQENSKEKLHISKRKTHTSKFL